MTKAAKITPNGASATPGMVNFITQKDLVQISIGFGLATFIGVSFAQGSSGGLLNPALALSHFLLGKIGLLRAILYTGVQCLGAIGNFTHSKSFKKIDIFNGDDC